MFILTLEHLAASFEISIQTRHFFPEVFQRTFKEVIRYEKIFLHVFLFQLVSGLTRQDHELTDHVLTAQVDARIGFRITLFLRHLDGTAEGNIGTDLIENIVQRTRKHCLDLQNLITAMYQVIDGIDNRKSGSHVSFKQIFHATLTGYQLQFTVILVSR